MAIDNIPWVLPATRARPLTDLHSFADTDKLAYPDKSFYPLKIPVS